MKKIRRFRVSCFAAGVPLNGSCDKHTASRSLERATEVFFRERKQIPGRYALVVLHQGNLRDQSYRILQICSDPWTRADELTYKHTTFPDFNELIHARGGYFPSLNTANSSCLELANLYDEAQEGRGDRRRVFRYGT